MNLFNTLRRHSALLSLLCVSFLVTACGGGGGGGSDAPGGGGGGAPTANIVFPPTDSIFTGDVLVVRGTASDDGTVESVKVNGVAAESSDGFATWMASVPLDMGDNVIEVSVEDDTGNKTDTAASVDIARHVLPMAGLTGIKIDSANNRAVVADSSLNAIFGIDLDTGERTVLSSAAVGSGPMYESTLNIDISSDGKLAYMFDWVQRSYFEVNLVTGVRRILSSPSVGTGDELGVYVYDVALDEANARSFLVSLGDAIDEFYVFEVDHVTGDRNRVTSTGTGGDEQPLGVEWDSVLGRLLVTTTTNNLLFVDPASGVRTEIDFTGPASGFWSYDVALDKNNNRAFVIQTGDVQIFSVDLASGETEVLSAGSGTPLNQPNAIAYDAAENRLLVVGLEGEVVTIDLATKSRELLANSYDAKIGSGDFIWNIAVVAFDPAKGTAYAKEYLSSRFAKIDLTTGARTFPGGTPALVDLEVDARDGQLLGITAGKLASVDPETGGVTELADFSATRITFNGAGNRVYGSSYNAISAISLDDYTVTSLASFTVGSGEFIRNASAIAVDGQRSRVVFADNDPAELKALAADGTRTDLINSGDTATPRLLGIRDMVVDGSGNNVFALDGRNGTLMSINLDTMKRTVLAGARAGSGAATGITNGLAVDENAGLAWSSAAGSVIVFDIIGGDHVIISR